ncbi:MAG: SRPBCC domain-containing protein [Bacteroidota bacterium]
MVSEKVQIKFLAGNRVLFKSFYEVPKVQLWHAITKPEELENWFMKTEIDIRVGGKFAFKGGWKGWIENLKVFEYIQYNSSLESFTRLDIISTKNGVELHLKDQIPEDMIAPTDPGIQHIQPGGNGTHWVGLLAGWHDFLLALHSHLLREEVEDHFDLLCLKYRKILNDRYALKRPKNSYHLSKS